MESAGAESPAPDPANETAASRTPEMNAESQSLDEAEEIIQQKMQNPKTGYIYQMLIDRESPILGVKWGGYALLDTPLNNEPPGANPTLRKAQLSFHRGFGADWALKLTANYNNAGRFELSDNYLNYSGWQTGIARVGIFGAPFSLESVSQTTALTFMERSLPVTALAPPKTGGIGFLKRTEASIWSAELSIANPNNEGISQNGQSVMAHYAHSPIDVLGSKGVHFGASLAYGWNISTDNLRFRSRPEVATIDDFYVDTGEIGNAEQVLRFGLEGHAKITPALSWQAEWLSTQVQRKDQKSVRFKGGYAFLSWFVTEDQRNYDAGSGRFLAVLPSSPFGRNGTGAIELAARASFVDLNDGDILGGAEKNLSLGVNWYLNPQVRIMSNLVKVLDIDRPGSEFDGTSPLIWTLRLQWQMRPAGR